MYFIVQQSFEWFAQGDILLIERCETLGSNDVGLFRVDGLLLLSKEADGELIGRVAKQIIVY